MKNLSIWISKFSFFEYIGLLTFGTIISNYFLDKPLINISAFFIYCAIGLVLSTLKLYLNFKKFTVIVKSEK